MSTSVLKFVPPSVFRLAGRMQFRYPILQKPINLAAQQMLCRRPGQILWGTGRGLRFNAERCNPGFLLGTSEPLEQRWVSELLSDGDVFYDVGANAGFYAMIAARRVGTSGCVYAFEPTPMLAQRVRENADLNEFDQVKVVPSAVGRENGLIEFGIEDDLGVQNSIHARGENAQTISVECVTLDEFAKHHRPPDLVLMDIEGAELDALEGALQTITRHRPTLMIEVHWLGQPFLDFLETHLLPLGYHAITYAGEPLPGDSSRYHCLLRPEEEVGRS